MYFRLPELAFDASDIMETLLALPKVRGADAVVRAARLYASAMERIESQIDTCYQHLIAAAETMAGAALDGWRPDDAEQLRSMSRFVEYAVKEEKLSEDVAKRLALAACKSNTWSGKRFKKFIIDNIDRQQVSSQDDVFPVPPELLPAADKIEQALNEVYRSRSGATHGGHSYPASAVIGTSPMIPVAAFDEVGNGQRPFPPIAWFERVVNHAIRGFLRAQVAQLRSMRAQPNPR